MSDRSNKEQQAQKEPKRSLAPSSARDPKWIVAGGLALAIAFYGFYYFNSSQDRNLSDITRPPLGFEAFEEVEEDPVIAMEDTSDLNDVSEVPQEIENSDDDVDPLHTRLQELEQLNHEKDRLITDLSQQLSDVKHGNSVQAYPVTGKTTGKETVRESGQRTHTVKKGETLSEIARSYYGSGTRWKEIYEANSEKLGDKNRVRVGTVLVIPE